MKIALRLAPFLLLAALPSLFADEWITDYKAAIQQAGKENKTVFMDFTGSDWCVWCIKLEKEVFSKRDFLDYAKKNFILLKIDVPKPTTPQPAELKAQNKELQLKYNIHAWPTVILLDANEKQIGQLVGYPNGDAKAYMRNVKKLPK